MTVQPIAPYQVYVAPDKKNPNLRHHNPITQLLIETIKCGNGNEENLKHKVTALLRAGYNVNWATKVEDPYFPGKYLTPLMLVTEKTNNMDLIEILLREKALTYTKLTSEAEAKINTVFRKSNSSLSSHETPFVNALSSPSPMVQ